MPTFPTQQPAKPIKSTAKTVFLFYGEDTHTSNEKVALWKTEFIKKYGEEANVEVLDGKSLDIRSFVTNLESIPFLCEKRLIIIKNFLEKGGKEDQKIVADALEKTPDFAIVLFHETEVPNKTTSLFKKIKKIGKIEEFAPLSQQEALKWTLNKAKKEDIKISTVVANYLNLQCGIELWRISTELEKLKTYADGKEITQSMIDELVTPSLTASIFKLTDSIAAKNVKESLKTFETLNNSGEDLTMVFFMIVRHFRILIQVQEMAQKKENQATMAKRLKQHPFVVLKTASQSKNFTQQKLEEIYKNLLEIDRKFKTGIIKSYPGDNREYSLAIEKLIIECCR